MKDLNKKLFYKLRPNHVWNKETKSWDILNNMIKLSEEQEKEYNEAKNCKWCRNIFNEQKEETIKLKRKALLNTDCAVCTDCYILHNNNILILYYIKIFLMKKKKK